MDNRFFNSYPYTDFHELNLSWVISELRSFATTLEQFVSINALKYADPIDWNITTQYEKNTIVIDAQTGTAYISVAPVPAGVALSNTDYWTVVFDLSMFIVRAAQNFTTRWEQDTTTTATFATSAGDWLVWGDVLYRANVNITPGDSYVVDGNITHITMEEIIGHIEDLTTTDKSNLVAAINEILSTLIATTGDLNDLTTTNKSNLVAAINDVLGTLSTQLGDLDDLTTDDKTNIVSAINEINGKPSIVDRFDLDLIAQHTSVYTDTTYRYTQGGCVVDDKYYVFGNLATGGDNVDLIVYDIENETVLRHAVLELYHCNSITYDNNKLYIVTNTTPTIIVVDYGTLSIIDTITLSGDNAILSTLKKVNDKWYAINQYLVLGEIDLVNDTFTPIFTLTNITAAADNQDFTMDDKYIYCLTLKPQVITIYDKVGNVIKNIPVSAFHMNRSLGEFQSINIGPGVGDLYISQVQIITTGVGPCVTKLYKTNIFKSVEVNNRNLEHIAGNRFIVYVDASASAIEADGTSTHPFSQIADAIDYAKIYYPNSEVEIILAAGTYDAVMMRGDNLFIYGDVADISEIVIKGLICYDCKLDLRNVTIDGVASNNAMLYTSHSDVRLYNVSFGTTSCQFFGLGACSTIRLENITTPDNVATSDKFFFVQESEVLAYGIDALSCKLSHSFGLQSERHAPMFTFNNDYCWAPKTILNNYSRYFYGAITLDYPAPFANHRYMYLDCELRRRSATFIIPLYNTAITNFDLYHAYLPGSNEMVEGFLTVQLDYVANTISITTNKNRKTAPDSGGVAGLHTISTKTDNTVDYEFLCIRQVCVQ